MADADPLLRTLSLADRYSLGQRDIYANGSQVLVRLLLVQAERDRRAGLRTGGFVSGYRGSPLGGLDRELWHAEALLKERDVRFWPGVNEDLAATAVWGSQQVPLDPSAKVQGVFGLWYGKGAGLDRSGDAFRHANAAGVSAKGGVLAIIGDDHAQKSSTNPYSSDRFLSDLLMPVLAPADLDDMLRLGIIGWGMSRFSGGWSAMKVLPDHMDCSAPVRDLALDLVLERPDWVAPFDVHLRWPDAWTDAEVRTVGAKLDRAVAYARSNRVNRIETKPPSAAIGLIASGKTYIDLREAMRILGMDLDDASRLGLRIYRLGMTWPLDEQEILDLSSGLRRLLVIEEKRSFIEEQVKAILCNSPRHPPVFGKRAADGEWQFPWIGELGPDIIALALARNLAALGIETERFTHAAQRLEAQLSRSAQPAPVTRKPYFCSGCPHNRSTLVPDGSKAMVGVGCHFLASGLDRNSSALTQMGGEGANWIGQAPFVGTDHVFVNLGDGTYYHSGSLAIRAAVAAGVNATYKILFNDAVAMTGGQPVDGPITVNSIVGQVLAEGVRNLAVVSEAPERFQGADKLPPEVSLWPRSELDAVQRRLRDMPGVTVLVYDQTCAAEKRRRRKRKLMPQAQQRVFINHLACEACGDCSRASNCLSVVPRNTEYGRKRQIDQASCNQDMSCVEGFCPSIVTVEGQLRRPVPPVRTSLPEPERTAGMEEVANILLAGTGGTGVTTAAALLGIAAHLERRAVRVLDMTGLAQKGGAVVSHVRIGQEAGQIHCAQTPLGSLDLLIGFDMVVTAQADILNRTDRERTYAIVNAHEQIISAEPSRLAEPLPLEVLQRRIADALLPSGLEIVEATALANQMFGDPVALNLMLIGIAYQRGRLPLSSAAIDAAIRLNGVAVDLNLGAFHAGRVHALEGASTHLRAEEEEPVVQHVARLADELRAYQSNGYAQHFLAAIEEVKVAETRTCGTAGALVRSAAEGLFRLMAYKDEYEVARLFTDGRFEADLLTTFQEGARLRYHMAPPLLGSTGPDGRPRKIALPAAARPLLRGLARLRRLRGTPFDPFGWTRERRAERALIGTYLAGLRQLGRNLDRTNHGDWLAWTALAQGVRGYGAIKRSSMERFTHLEAESRQAISHGRACESAEAKLSASIQDGPVRTRHAAAQ